VAPHFEPSLSASRSSSSGGIPLFDHTDAPSPSDTNDEEVNTPSSSYEASTMEAANAMNSIGFLKELIGRKINTFDEVYFREEEDGRDDPGRVPVKQMGRYRSVPPQAKLHGTSMEGWRRMTSTCEYTGRQPWFKRRGGGIRFRDTIRVRDGGVDGVAVECLTRYKHKGNWVDCSKVVCRFTIPPPTEEDMTTGRRTKKSTVRMNMDSEVLLRAPLFGISGAVKERNIRTFGSAAEDFYKGVNRGAKR